MYYMILSYLLDNSMPILNYLDNKTRTKFYILCKELGQFLSEDYWISVLKSKKDIQSINSNDKYIIITHSPTHKTLYERNIYKYIFRYIAMYS